MSLLRPGALLACLAVAACGGSSLSAQDKTARCEAFADAVAVAQLTDTPAAKLAEDVANSLDPLVPKMSTPALHGPAVEIHQDLHRIAQFGKRKDTARADRQAESARRHAAELAKACGLPVERFLS